jgi:hypothetical protein
MNNEQVPYSKEKIMSVVGEILDDAKKIKPYVIIAQPRRNLEETPCQHLDGALGIHVDFCGYSHAFVNIGGEKVDVARNYLMDVCIESDAKYMLFAGEDTVLPYDGFLKLLETAEANPNSVVTGVYYIKLSSPMIHVRDENNFVIPADVTPGKIMRNINSCGMDAMLIPIEVLRKMKETEPELPFCCIYFNPDNPKEFIGEDNFFTHRLHKAGVEIICDTRVQCLHMDLLTGKYTANPDIDINKYFTNIPIGERLTFEDKRMLDKRYVDRIPKGSWPETQAEVIPIK